MFNSLSRLQMKIPCAIANIFMALCTHVVFLCSFTFFCHKPSRIKSAFKHGNIRLWTASGTDPNFNWGHKAFSKKITNFRLHSETCVQNVEKEIHIVIPKMYVMLLLLPTNCTGINIMRLVFGKRFGGLFLIYRSR